MPITEHPFYGSWGYQTTGYFAPTARYGTPQDFMYFVDHLHQRGHRRDPRLGAVALPDRRARPRATSTARTSTSTPTRARASTPSGTARSSTTAATRCAASCSRSALFWLDRYHIDGLRVDAVASMLYLDYARKAGEWIPNQLRRPREPRGDRLPAARSTARSTASTPTRRRSPRSRPPGRMVSRPTDMGGLGFGMKWNMGWMHDTLDYFAARPGPPPLPPRRAHLLALSTRSARTSCCRSRTTRWCTARARCSARCRATTGSSSPTCALLFGYMWAHPGKKLLFMGGEFGQRREWTHDGELDWRAAAAARRTPACSAGCATSTASTATSRRCTSATSRRDGFEWIDARRREQQRARLPAQGGATATRRCWSSATSRRCRAATTASACRRAASGARSSTATRAITAAAGWATWAASQAAPRAGARPAAVADA